MTKEEITIIKQNNRELVDLMKSFRKSSDNIRDYRKFLKFKDSIPNDEFFDKYIKNYSKETINSNSFGTKTFYKPNFTLMYFDLFITL